MRWSWWNSGTTWRSGGSNRSNGWWVTRIRAWRVVGFCGCRKTKEYNWEHDESSGCCCRCWVFWVCGGHVWMKKREKNNGVEEGTKWVWLVGVKVREWKERSEFEEMCVCVCVVVLLDGYGCFVIYQQWKGNNANS